MTPRRPSHAPENEPKPELIVFVRRYIRSVEKLEILVLLQETPAQTWSAQAVYEVTRSNPVSVEQCMRELCRDGLIQMADGPAPVYFFEPVSKELAGLVADLAALYKEKRVRVLQMIYPGA